MLIQPSGGKLWRLKYRIEGKEKKLETRKNRVISGWLDDVEAARRTKGIVRTDFHDAWR